MSEQNNGPELRAPQRTQSQRRAGGLGIALAMIAAFVALIWYAYTDVQRGQTQKEPPVIQAEEGPVRIRPEEPGGREIPNEDSTVFDVAREDSAQQDGDRVESLLPPQELPADKPTPVAQDAASDNGGGSSAGDDDGEQQKDAAVDPTTAEEADKPKPAENAEKTSTDPESGAQSPTRDTAPEKPAGLYRIQLGSLRTQSLARREWQRLRKRYPESLSGLDLSLQQVDLGDRGTFYRVQAGPLTETEAEQICNVIRPTNPGGCLVVEP